MKGDIFSEYCLCTLTVKGKDVSTDALVDYVPLRRSVFSASLSAGAVLSDQTGYCALIQNICRSPLKKGQERLETK